MKEPNKCDLCPPPQPCLNLYLVLDGDCRQEQIKQCALLPVYRIEFTLYAGDNEIAGCEQDMMLIQEYKNHKAAEESLWRVVQSLAENLNIIDMVTGWAGFIILDRYDSWCLHWKSHYTYRRFSSPDAALIDFAEFVLNQNQSDWPWVSGDWHVCGCDICKKLNRTMILHVGEKECPDCSSLW